MKLKRYDDNEVLYTIEFENDLARIVAPLSVEAEQTLSDLVESRDAVTRAVLKVKNSRDNEQGPYEATTVIHTKNGQKIVATKKGKDPAVVLSDSIKALERPAKLLVRSDTV